MSSSDNSSTQFCECGSVMFIAGDEGLKTYFWFCSRCSSSKPIAGNTVVFETRKHDAGAAGSAQQLDKYITLDPTLKHEWMPCPNEECPSHPSEDGADVVIVRTNHARMEYSFVCTECQHSWKAAI